MVHVCGILQSGLTLPERQHCLMQAWDLEYLGSIWSVFQHPAVLLNLTSFVKMSLKRAQYTIFDFSIIHQPHYTGKNMLAWEYERVSHTDF